MGQNLTFPPPRRPPKKTSSLCNIDTARMLNIFFTNDSIPCPPVGPAAGLGSDPIFWWLLTRLYPRHGSPARQPCRAGGVGSDASSGPPHLAHYIRRICFFIIGKL